MSDYPDCRPKVMIEDKKYHEIIFFFGFMILLFIEIVAVGA